jgi:hypothetical protein
VEDGLSILRYTDDTLLFLEHDLEKYKYEITPPSFRASFGS